MSESWMHAHIYGANILLLLLLLLWYMRLLVWLLLMLMPQIYQVRFLPSLFSTTTPSDHNNPILSINSTGYAHG